MTTTQTSFIDEDQEMHLNAPEKFKHPLKVDYQDLCFEISGTGYKSPTQTQTVQQKLKKKNNTIYTYVKSHYFNDERNYPNQPTSHPLEACVMSLQHRETLCLFRKTRIISRNSHLTHTHQSSAKIPSYL